MERTDRLESLLDDWRTLGRTPPSNPKKIASLKASPVVARLLAIPRSKRLSAGQACILDGGLTWDTWLAACERERSTKERQTSAFRPRSDSIPLASRGRRAQLLTPNEVRFWRQLGTNDTERQRIGRFTGGRQRP